jgi:serine phosphatase RsbU (regulator of sigma subunit)
MDMAICSIDKKSKKLSFSGAKNPLLLVRGDKITKYAGDKLSIGQHSENSENCFEQQSIDIQENDMLYLISDGMQDQFGGPHGKKFMLAKLKELLIRISKDPVEQQYQHIDTSLTEWMGDLAQVDDITIMGIRVTKELI